LSRRSGVLVDRIGEDERPPVVHLVPPDVGRVLSIFAREALQESEADRVNRDGHYDKRGYGQSEPR
jgi:hypothetical protein